MRSSLCRSSYSGIVVMKKGPRPGWRWARNLPDGDQAVKLLPHPQPPVALGLLNVKPEPCMELT